MEQARSGRKSDVLLINRHFAELNPVIVGQEVCAPGHRFGPSVRKYVLLHCVLSGKGTYTCGGVTYPVAAGQIFRILPGEETVYQADTRDPWHYAWIGFDGRLAEKMATMPPVFSVSATVTNLFRRSAENTDASVFGLTANLFRLYDELFADHTQNGNEYVRRIRSYIDAAYMKKISVEGLAEQLHLNRRYMTRLFHAETGMSIRDYLLRTRMRRQPNVCARGCRSEKRRSGADMRICFSFQGCFARPTGSVRPGGKTRNRREEYEGIGSEFRNI